VTLTNSMKFPGRFSTFCLFCVVFGKHGELLTFLEDDGVMLSRVWRWVGVGGFDATGVVTAGSWRVVNTELEAEDEVDTGADAETGAVDRVDTGVDAADTVTLTAGTTIWVAGATVWDAPDCCTQTSTEHWCMQAESTFALPDLPIYCNKSLVIRGEREQTQQFSSNFLIES